MVFSYEDLLISFFSLCFAVFFCGGQAKIVDISKYATMAPFLHLSVNN